MTSSRMKMLTLALMIILVTLFSVLIDFITAEFSTSIFSDVSYWLNTLSVQVSVVVLIFVSRSLAKEKERGTNNLFKTMTEAIQQAYVTLNRDNLNGAFRDYIAADNRARKLKVYRAHLSAKAMKYSDRIKRLELALGRAEYKKKSGLRFAVLERRLARAKNKLDFWTLKIERAEDDVDFVRIKYIKYSCGIIFNDAQERASEEDDPAAHEGRDVAHILLTKAIGIFAFGIIATSYLAFDIAFSWGMVLKAIVKLFQILLGLYTGTVSGQDFIRQTMCAKLTIRCNYVKQFMEQRKGAVAGPAPAAVVPSQPV